jgi:CBS domain-containing protein
MREYPEIFEENPPESHYELVIVLRRIRVTKTKKCGFSRPWSKSLTILGEAYFPKKIRSRQNTPQTPGTMPKDTLPEEGTQPKELADVLVEKTGALSVHETVQDAGDKLRALEVDSLPVSENRRLVGMVNERHPDRSAAGHGHDPQVERVGAYMSRDLVFCYEDQDRNEAEKLMKAKGLTYLPIVDHDMRIVGIVTRQDCAAKAAAQNPA